MSDDQRDSPEVPVEPATESEPAKESEPTKESKSAKEPERAKESTSSNDSPDKDQSDAGKDKDKPECAEASEDDDDDDEKKDSDKDAKGSNAKGDSDSTKYIKLRVVGNHDTHGINFRLKYSTALCKLKKSYSNHVGIPTNNLRFLFDGRRISDEDTPKQLDMNDDDQIEVYHEQTGGC